MEVFSENIDEFQLILRIGLTMLLGLLVGIERGWSMRYRKEGNRTAGIRTFTLIGLAGGLWGLLARQLGMDILGFALVAFVLIIMIGYIRNSMINGDVGLTTEMAAFVTFTACIAVVLGYVTLSAGAIIIMTFILSVKPRLHRWLKTIESRELYSGLFFLIISAVLLPLLPDQGYGPWEVFNPFEIWGMVVLITGISYVGYFSMKYLGQKKGILFTAFTGSVVSSLAITVTLAKFSRKMEHADLLVSGILISTFTALSRILVLVIIFNPVLFWPVSASVFTMVLVSLILISRSWKKGHHADERQSFDIKNPLQLGTALQFGLLLAVVLILSAAAQQWLGDPGIYGVSLFSGMIDIDSITLSLLQMSKDTLSYSVAVNAVVLAACTNTLIKGGLCMYFAGYKKTRRLIVPLSLIALSGLPALLFL